MSTEKETAMNGAQDIVLERYRQITEEGYTAEHDQRHSVQDFVNAAIAYLGEDSSTPWLIKRSSDDYWSRKDLVKAGALIAAAIDRWDEHVQNYTVMHLHPSNTISTKRSDQ